MLLIIEQGFLGQELWQVSLNILALKVKSRYHTQHDEHTAAASDYWRKLNSSQTIRRYPEAFAVSESQFRPPSAMPPNYFHLSSRTSSFSEIYFIIDLTITTPFASS